MTLTTTTGLDNTFDNVDKAVLESGNYSTISGVLTASPNDYFEITTNSYNCLNVDGAWICMRN